jgi:CHAT domain-containing protein
MPTQPIALLVFAQNDLNHIAAEIKHLRALFEATPQIEARFEEGLNKTRFSNAVTECGQRLHFFHFAGHATIKQLSLSDWTTIDKHRFVSILNAQNAPLDFVFLNGCTTHGYVVPLLASGAKAIIVTNKETKDSVGMRLAVKFYELFLLKGVTLQKAFETATATYASGAASHIQRINASELMKRNHQKRIGP